MNSAYSYKYANLPSDYYDYSYDAGTLTDIPSKNMYKKRNNMFTRISVGSSDDYDRDYHHMASGYGHHVGCYEEGVSIGLLLTTFLGIAIMGYTLYTKIKANGGKRRRKKRSVVGNLDLRWVLLFPEIILMGESYVFKMFVTCCLKCFYICIRKCKSYQMF